MSLQKLPPERSLAIVERHPVRKQAKEDVTKFTIEQVIYPSVMAIASLFFGWWFGAVSSFMVGALIFLCAAGVTWMAYMLLMVLRAPYVVISRHEQELTERAQQMAELGLRLEQIEARQFQPQSMGQVGLTAEALKTIEQSHELKKLEPNIQWSDPRVTDAYRGEDGVIFEGETVGSAGSGNLKAVVAPLENYLPTANKKIVGVQNVSARLIYNFFDKSHMFEINRGAWLSKKTCTVDFGINDRNEVVVATVEGEDKLFVNSCSGSTAAKVIRGVELTQDLVSVSVRLIAESESRALKTVDYVLEVTREPKFKVEMHRAFVWKVGHLNDFRVQAYEFMLRYHQVWKESQERREAIRDFFNEEVLAWKKKQEEEIAEQVKGWEATVAAFIETHWGEKQKKDFLNTTPSIDDGLNEKPRLIILPRNTTRTSTTEPTHWYLSDSIRARADKLNVLMEGVMRST